MTKNEYLKQLGFFENPFQYTNADKESSIIEKYFIAPDYFEDVWGDPENPVSNIVYAPRGGGKTAQRLMIEKRAAKKSDILTITYTDHDLSHFKSVNEISISYHLEYLNRLMILAFFDKLGSPNDFRYSFEFSYKERQFLYKLCKIYLFETPASFPRQAVSSLKNIEDHCTDLWLNFKEPISKVISSITKAHGAEIDFSKVEIDKKLKLSHKDNFINIKQFLERIGYKTIYILVDKVDEQSLTGNDPRASYIFISELIKDLELLETPGIGFKFFLWDALRPYCAKDARPDRIFSFNLKWEYPQIRMMLNKRIQAYSNNKIEKGLNIFEQSKSLGRIILFSEFSPRDCVRICNRTLTEQFKHGNSKLKFEHRIVNNSINLFVKEKIEELLLNPTNIRHLAKVGSVSFTIEDLVTKKVSGKIGSARNIIVPWTNGGLLKKIGLVTRKNKKAVNEYAFVDVRAARFACSAMTLDDFVENKVRRCKLQNCKTFSYRDFDLRDYQCLVCATDL